MVCDFITGHFCVFFFVSKLVMFLTRIWSFNFSILEEKKSCSS